MAENENSYAARLLDAFRQLDPASGTPGFRIQVWTSCGTSCGTSCETLCGTIELTAAGVAASIAALEKAVTATRIRPGIDPLLLVQIENHFANVDPESYLADVFGGPDAEASVAAYEQLVTGEWDGEL
ncbi:hypothetical protein [Streptomyces sp. NPDC004728]|uniref:hypothetical protein n=1 Tax=Streptomyces sp. NPDC004728 TaxID=3154289 RepID=UPI0033B1EB15